MKRFIIYSAITLLCAIAALFVCSPTAEAQTAKSEQTITITQDEALKICNGLFPDYDADYYIRKETVKTATYWVLFVDAEPLKGWEHDCYLVAIPKTVSEGTKVESLITKEKREVPPTEGDFTPLSVKKRYPNSSNIKPTVKKQISSNADNSDASRTYAIILSGGISKISNYERYWNDCSFIYQTLVNKYGVPKSNIYPIMSDGDDPAEDMRCYMGGFASQSLDLDFDGVADISLAASKNNVVNTLNTLARKLNKDDQLFIYVIDHGGQEVNSYICLWNNEKLYDYELGNLLTSFTDKYVNVNVVMGQCYSGGFIKYLNKPGIVVATASDRVSWGCSNMPYDEFVYKWTCAVNEADHYGKAVYSDTDRNGRVTMEEAFTYAEAKDTQEENPRYESTPTSVGQDLSLDHVVKSIDLYIKDNEEDEGREPNTSAENDWTSPSIWVRNKEDGIYQNEHAEYSADHKTAYIYVRVHNRGKEDYLGKDKSVYVYWTQAYLGPMSAGKMINPIETNDDNALTEGFLRAVPIDSIKAGQYRDVSIKWELPGSLIEKSYGNFDYCLLAIIIDTPKNNEYPIVEIDSSVLAANDRAQKDVTIIKGWTLHALAKLYIRGEVSEVQNYSIELTAQGVADEELFDVADVKMQLSDKLYRAWELGGFQASDIELADTGSDESDYKSVKLLSPQCKMGNIGLSSEFRDMLTLEFNFKKHVKEYKTYSYDLIMRNSTGSIVGGHTFIIEPPVVVGGGAVDIEPIPGEIDSYQLTTHDNYKAYTWLNQRGEIIGNSESVTVNPKPYNQKFEILVATETGEVASGAISFEDNIGIEAVTASETNRCINVKLRKAAPENATISIVSIMDGTISTVKVVPAGAKEVTVDSDMLIKGNYLVIYSINSEIIDEKKLSL